MYGWIKKIAAFHVFALWALLLWLYVCVYHLCITPVAGSTLAKGATLVGAVVITVLSALVAVLTAVGGISIRPELAEAFFVGSIYAFVSAGLGALIAAPYVAIPWSWATVATAVAIVTIVATLACIGAGPPAADDLERPGRHKSVHTAW
jgi:hypothetical protein